MPYLEKANRADVLRNQYATTAGELNFLITQTCLSFLAKTKGRYDDYNTIIGALEAAKLEFYRRAAAPYEDKKIKENGDVY